MSDQDNGCLEELQEHFKIEEKDKEVTYEKHDDEHGMDNVLDIIYHDIDMDDAEVDEHMRSGTVSFANKDTFRGFFSSDIQRCTGTCNKNIPYNNLGTISTMEQWSIGGHGLDRKCLWRLYRNILQKGGKAWVLEEFWASTKEERKLVASCSV